MRRLVSLVFVACIVLPGSARVQADSAADQAAREIADARERANAAADAYFKAESRLDSLDLAEQALNADVAGLQAQVNALQDRVQRIAVNRFTRSSAESSPLLNGFSTPEEQMQVAALSEVINDTSEEDFDRFQSLQLELGQKQQALATAKTEVERQRDALSVLRDQTTAEVKRLKEVEADRLKNEAVRAALVALEASRAADAAAAAAAAAAPTTTIAEIFDPTNDDGGGGGPSTPQPIGSGAGGQTGGGGAGGRPGGAGVIDYATPGWVCPTGDYPVAFGDTWGAPRSGGRRHQGVDMIGPIGVPVLAVVDGFAKPWTSELGGFVLSLFGADGNRYFYGHFDSMGFSGPVKAGDVVGIMGQTGNARFSVPHLHFEIHPAGGAAVNPYPTVRAHC